MLIKQSKRLSRYFGGLLIAMIPAGNVCAIADAVHGRESWYTPYAWAVFLIGIEFAFLHYCIARFRTFVMDETGCTVYLLWYKKHYRWDELEMKQYVKYGDPLKRYSTSMATMMRGAEFSVKRRKISRRRDGYNYSFFHPFTFISITFLKNGITLEECNKRGMYYYYPVEEDVFRAKMKEWNVEMEETERGIGVPKSDEWL